MTKEEINIQNTSVETLVNDVCTIIEHGREVAYSAVNTTMIETYWENSGRRTAGQRACRIWRTAN